MPKQYKAQNLTFSMGEISPLLFARSDTEGYSNAVATMENFTANARGAAERRLGSEYLNEFTGDTARVETINIDRDTFFVFVFTSANTYILTQAGVIRDTFSSFHTEAQLETVQFTPVPNGRTVYVLHPNVAPRKVVYNKGTDTFTYPIVAFLNPPAAWTGTNWPSTGTHFQGRLWLASTPDQQETMWGSFSGTDEDFITTPSGASAGLEFSLARYGRIEWLIATKNITVGTENGEHILTSDATPITESDFQFTQQSAYGSIDMQARQVGDKVMYLSSDGTKLRHMQYEWQSDNWLSQDITFPSEHILSGIGRRIVWDQNPNTFLWVILRDGNLACATYERTTDTTGWHRHFTTGTYLDLATAELDGVSILFSIVQREAGNVYLEKRSATHLDSSINQVSAATNTVTGLAHLEGQTVRPLVKITANDDYAVDPTQVVSGGQITTQTTGVDFVVGLDYTSKIITLPPDSQGQTLRSWKKRWGKVWALLSTSAFPKINGILPPERTPATLMDQREPNVTFGHVKSVNIGWDDFGQITITQDLPLPTTVLAIYGELGAESL